MSSPMHLSMTDDVSQSSEIQPLPAITITIDGPAGAGKSSVAQSVAHQLGLDFLDTGAMYRAIAWVALECGISLDDVSAAEPQVIEAFEKATPRFDWTCSPPRIWVNWPITIDVSERIRDADVTRAVSVVARMPLIRAALVVRQRAIRDDHPRLVTEGRDQGSVVFPDAEVRLYLDASARERAHRRSAQLMKSGRVQHVDLEKILEEILRRDRLDRERTDGPLIQPEGAIVIDSTGMDREEVIQTIIQTVRAEVSSEVATSFNPRPASD